MTETILNRQDEKILNYGFKENQEYTVIAFSVIA